MPDYLNIKNLSTNKRLKFLLKDAVLYGGAGAFAKLFSIFTVPVLTRILSREEFGIIDGIGIFAAIFPPLMLMGLNSGIARFFYDTDDQGCKREIISQGLFTELIFTIIITIVLYFNAGWLLKLFFGTAFYTHYFRIVIITMFFSVFVMFAQNLLKWTFSRAQYLIISLGTSILTVSLTIFYVLVLKLNVVGVFLAHLCSSLFFAIIAYGFTKKHLIFPKNIQYVIPMLKFSWPLMLVALIPALIPSVDRYFIINYIGLEILAIYAVGLKIANLLQLPVLGFQTAWGPFALYIFREKNAEETYNKIFLYYTIFLSAFALLLVIFAEPLIRIFASTKYLKSITVILPLTFAMVIDSLSWISGIGISLSKKTIYKALSYLITLFFSIIIIWILIKPFGLLGVVYGLLISKIILTFSKTFFAYRLYPIRFSYRQSSLIIMIGFLLALSFRLIKIEKLLFQIAAGLASILLFLFIMWQVFILEQDKTNIKQIIRKYLLFLPLRK